MSNLDETIRLANQTNESLCTMFNKIIYIKGFSTGFVIILTIWLAVEIHRYLKRKKISVDIKITQKERDRRRNMD